MAAESSARFSLREMLDHDQFHLSEYCRDYRPNPYGAEMYKAVEKFGRHYGIWLDDAKHYISCTDYLYPSASLEKLVPIGKNLAIDFYLNDTIGREKAGHLTPEQQQAARRIRRPFVATEDDFPICPGAHPVELANAEMLADIRTEAPTDWFTEFLRLWKYQIDIAHIDRNASALGYIPGIEEYIDSRCHVSGMHHTIQLMEFADDHFLDWPRLTTVGIAHPLRQIRNLVARIGCLMNDLFSFEKEFIDNGSDSNLVTVIVLNEPSLALSEAIVRAAAIVRGFIAGFLTLIGEVRNQGHGLLTTDRGLANMLETHLRSLEQCVQAGWVWQVYTMRYKRAASIWREARLAHAPAKNTAPSPHDQRVIAQ